MKENTVKKSLILVLLGLLSFALALLVPKLIDNFLICVITLIPILAIALGCLLQGGYELLKKSINSVLTIRS